MATYCKKNSQDSTHMPRTNSFQWHHFYLITQLKFSFSCLSQSKHSKSTKNFKQSSKILKSLEGSNDKWLSIWGSDKYFSSTIYNLPYRNMQPPQPFIWIWNSRCCNKLRQCRQRLGMQWNNQLSFFDRMMEARNQFPNEFFTETFIICVWQIWKQRNNFIFERSLHSFQSWNNHFLEEVAGETEGLTFTVAGSVELSRHGKSSRQDSSKGSTKIELKRTKRSIVTFNWWTNLLDQDLSVGINQTDSRGRRRGD
ncbi:hypothetical protein EJB05_29067, partial [Eragrostis curvula]